MSSRCACPTPSRPCWPHASTVSAAGRSVLQRAAAIAQAFWWGAVADLTSPEDQQAVAGVLQALVRKGLIRPGRGTFAGEDAFRFGHILVRTPPTTRDEGSPSRPARAVCRVDRSASGRAAGARRDSGSPPRAGARLPGRTRAGRPRRAGSRARAGRATGSCGPKSARPRRCARRGKSLAGQRLSVPETPRCSSTIPRRISRSATSAGGAGELAAFAAARRPAMPAARSPPDWARRSSACSSAVRAAWTKSPTRSTAPADVRGRRRRLDGGAVAHPARGGVLVALSGLSDGGDPRARTRARPPCRGPPPRVGGLGPAGLRDPVRPAGDRPRPSSAGRVGRGRGTGECGQGGCSSRRACWPRWPAHSTMRARVVAKGRRSSTPWAVVSALLRSRRGRARSSSWPAIPARQNESSRPAFKQLQEIGERANLASIAAQLAEALHAQGRSEEALAVTFDERGGVLARRRPRADLAAGRARESPRPARSRPGGGRDRRRRRGARRHDRLAGVRSRGPPRGRGGARCRRRGRGRTGCRGARAAALRGEGERHRSGPGASTQ